MALLRLPALAAALGLVVQHVAAGVIAGPALTCKTISDSVSSASDVIYPGEHQIHLKNETGIKLNEK
jgi:hypothetical protein